MGHSVDFFVSDDLLSMSADHSSLNLLLLTVASPGFVMRRGKDGNYHAALMVNFRAGCSSCSMTNSVVTDAVLIERAASC